MRSIDKNIKYEDLYHNIISEMEVMHKTNIIRLKKGLNCIVIVPTIFLLLLFITKSSKVVFLVLWIVSMFIIASYLIGIEYSDYKLQNRIREATHSEGREVTTLMTESIEQNKKALHDMLMSESSHLPIIGIINELENNDSDEEDKTSVFNKILENEPIEQTLVPENSDTVSERMQEVQEELVNDFSEVDEILVVKEAQVISKEIDEILSEFHNDFFSYEELKEFKVTDDYFDEDELKKIGSADELLSEDELEKIKYTDNLSLEEEQEKIKYTDSLLTKEELDEINNADDLFTEEELNEIRNANDLFTEEELKEITRTDDLFKGM